MVLKNYANYLRESLSMHKKVLPMVSDVYSV